MLPLEVTAVLAVDTAATTTTNSELETELAALVGVYQLMLEERAELVAEKEGEEEPSVMTARLPLILALLVAVSIEVEAEENEETVVALVLLDKEPHNPALSATSEATNTCTNH